ncbi:MAG: FAD-dependent oxidoreductase [Acidobacteria bacterium]|nr:FAD-dependent oxidoreductase [Acidobacteriota bacterium]
MAPSDRAVVVVGASAAGLRCACRLARLQPGWQVGVVEASPVFSYAACGLPYVLSGEISDPVALRQTHYQAVRDARFFAEQKGVTVLAGWRATEIRLAEGLLKVQSPEGERQLRWDELVLATGARARRLPGQPEHPRVRAFHRWDDLEPLLQGLRKGEIGRVAVVGAGLVGCELAEAFGALWGAEVTLVEAGSAPLPEMLDAEVGACVARHLETSGVELRVDSPVRRLEASDGGVTLLLDKGKITTDIVVVAVGVEPEVELARSVGARIGPTGAIAVDERLATSIPHVWAAGDCVEVRDVVTGTPIFRPLGSLANRQGRTLANILAGRGDAFPSVAGAVAVKVFDVNVAATGCTETRAQARGVAGRSVWVTADDRAHYWPESERIHLKLVYERGSQRVLGVQAVGKGEVVKRIDVATQLLARGATLGELAHVEHAYAPPYAPAVDVLSVAACVAQNQEDGVEAAVPTTPLKHVVDVRLPDERQNRPAGAAWVEELSVAELREARQVRTAPRGLVVCERGTRSAEAARLFLDRGGARYLGGGLQWREAALSGDAPSPPGQSAKTDGATQDSATRVRD